jgi:2-keto-4-pentenoate hydratase/2-oxohepta-3-ene-1,7-dioic acid hydratase in catechol pathway
MLIARYLTHDAAERCGRVTGDHVVEYEGATFDDWIGDPALQGSVPGGSTRSLSDIQLLPPIGQHAKVFCVGFNYGSHATEMATEAPVNPTLFVRFPQTIVGSGTPVVCPSESPEFDWEGEVALVIGRPGRRIAATEALDHVVGITGFADNSIRDWQFNSTQATAGKNWEDSGSCGPWILTGAAVEPDDARLVVRLNGAEVQSDSTANLVFDCARLVSYVSTFITLAPGDVIATGTPSGIGYRRQPQRFLRDGDQLEVEVEGVGVLRNAVRDARVLV